MAASTAKQDDSLMHSIRCFIGMCIATTFCVVYYFAPAYIVTALVSLLWYRSYLYAMPLIISIILPPIACPNLLKYLSPMADYFDFQEEFHDFTDDQFRKNLAQGKKYIFAFQPHGVLSLCGMTAITQCPPDVCRVKTAVARVLLQVPILKHVMGIYGLIDASKPSLIRHFTKNTGIDACLVLYVGGIAELFKSSRKEERLFLKSRKGFIKLALSLQDVDIVPCYLFGNTSALTVMKHGLLASASRKLQMSLTYFWGRYYLPIPRNDKMLYARGKPLGLPYIENPTDKDINEWHDKYCKEVSRIFDQHKEKLPMYKHKQLYID